MSTREETLKDRPSVQSAPAKPSPRAVTDPAAQPKAGADNAKPSSTTAAAEEIRPAPAKPDADTAHAAEAKVTPLQKEYDGLLEQIRDEVDPVKRAQLVQRKGNLTRQIDAIKRPARLP